MKTVRVSRKFLLATTTATLLGGWLLPLSAGAASPNGTVLAKRSLSAALHAGSFHYVAQSSGGGDSVQFTADVSATVGQQTITISHGSAIGTAQIIVIGSTAYFKGNTFAESALLGWTAAQSLSFQSQWISIPSSDTALYQNVAAAVTTQSAVKELTLGTSLSSKGTSKLSGKAVIKLAGPYSERTSTGTIKGSDSLVVQAQGSHLPLKYSLVTGKGTSRSTMYETLSSFGEPVSVSAPQGATPIATILGGAITPGQTAII